MNTNYFNYKIALGVLFSNGLWLFALLNESSTVGEQIPFLKSPNVISADTAEYIYLEAENGIINSPLQIKGNDPSASGGKYVYVPKGESSYSFVVPRVGKYRIWGRVFATNGGDNSFWIHVNNQPKLKWNHNAINAKWSWEGVQNFEKQEKIEYLLPAGKNELRIGYHEDGSKIDKILITDDFSFDPENASSVEAKGKYYYRIEAEDGKVSPPMQIAEDKVALNGKYVWVPDNFSEISFLVKKGGVYKIWGRILAIDGHSDSFIIGMDDEKPVRWNDMTRSSHWIWDDVHRIKNIPENTALFNLAKGEHVLKIKHREAGAQIDMLLITDNLSFIPNASNLRSASKK